MAKLVTRIAQLGAIRVQSWSHSYQTLVQSQVLKQCDESAVGVKLVNMLRIWTQSYSMMVHAHNNQNDGTTAVSVEDQIKAVSLFTGKNPVGVRSHQIGENVSRKDKISFLVDTLINLKDSKEAIYSALDTWVAWEQNFPIVSLKVVLATLEKEQQWHRVVQVIKWMLSKGQGNTMGTYGQLIRALDMDHRAEEAHGIWEKKIGSDLHSVSWHLCNRMISVYYRNNMLENLIKLFKGLEDFDRKPPEKSIVQKVADAYEILGLLQERDRVLEKYKNLFSETQCPKKPFNLSKKKKRKGRTKCGTTSDGLHNAMEVR
ncbi:hypothetical protein Vadar_018370 [Vaccinium darrowii]|uniref:Uncharacterized protein n=1 Tax=Vaccinium darrowii TaxID=229202 RepID=A0ACB7Z745_9ERIC|nr:hypothetical protein Vadar_018370 [Vaccinium darrowii]